jgi:hypothetical protein
MLIVCDRWLLDDLAADRLHYQLTRAPGDVAAIAARSGPLPVGATYRVAAERCVLRPFDLLEDHPGRRVEGAMLLRPGVEHHRDESGIEVPATAGRILVDPGAHVHDPWEAIGSVTPAVSEARPMLTRRPVVMFLVESDEVEWISWARSTADDLIGHQVEASLAAPSSPAGFHLSRPCSPERESVRSLRPDIVISFAADAESSLSDWLADDRNTVVIEWASDPRVGLELVSWRLGQARGRVRARVGAAADSAELARVINRLCGGPQPLPPIVAAPGGSTDDRRRGASAVFTTIRPRARSADRGAASAPITIAIGPSASDGVDGGDAARVEYLVDCLESAGRTTRTRRGGLDAVLDESGDGPAILHGYAPTAEMIPLVEQRRTAGRLTVLDLTADLLDRPVGVEASSLAIDEATRALARSCGALLCPSRSIATELSEPELATLALPTRPTRRQIDTMLTAGVRTDPGLVVGWRVDPAPQAEQAAVGRALELLLDRAPDLAVELCGPRADGIHLRASTRRRESAGEWLAQVWTIDRRAAELTGALRPLLDAGFAGIPTLVAATNPVASLVAHPNALVVDEPEDSQSWFGPLELLLADADRRVRLSSEVRGNASALFGAEGAALTANRLVGWLERGER